MGNYVTAAEIIAEGATASEARINARIEKWEAIIEMLTGNYFRVLEPGELIFDGNNMTTLFFSLPIIEVTSLKINSDSVALSSTEFRVYNRRTPPADDRKNPRIELVASTSSTSSLFTRAVGRFIKGYDQAITAKWGYVEDTAVPGVYAPPRPIKDSIIQLVMLDLTSYFDQSSNGGKSVASETTDGHSVSYGGGAELKRAWSMIPPEIADVLCLYRRAWTITAMDNPNPLVAW